RLDPRRDADASLGPGALPLALRADLLHLTLQLVGRELEPAEDRLDDVVVGEREEEMLGVHFSRAPFGGGPRGGLEDLLRLVAHVVGQVHRFPRGPCTATPAARPAGRGGPAVSAR